MIAQIETQSYTPMPTQEFTDVLFQRYGSAKKDTGTLTITQDSIQFNGRNEKLILTNIQFISYGKPGRFVFGDWLQVIYGGSLQPSVAYLRGAKHSGGTASLFSALHHFPNTHQLECTVWTYSNMPGLAPRKLGEFGNPHKAYLGATNTGILLLSISHEIKLAKARTEINGFTYERLTARQQVTKDYLNCLPEAQ